MKVRLKKSLSLISTVVLCCSALHATAQRKFSFGISADLAFYSYSKTWINNDDLEIKIRSGRKVNRLFDYIYHPQLFFTYRDQYNLSLSYSVLNQSISISNPKDIPGKFVSYRNATFIDLLLGYDFKHLLFKGMKTKSKIDIWGQLGITYLKLIDGNTSVQLYQTYDPFGESRLFSGKILDNKVRPLVQGLFRYSVFKHWYLQSAVNYRYLEKDWQPVCVVFGLGYKL